MLVKTGSPELKHVSFKTFLTTFSPKLSLLFPIPSKKSHSSSQLKSKIIPCQKYFKAKNEHCKHFAKSWKNSRDGKKCQTYSIWPFSHFSSLPCCRLWSTNSSGKTANVSFYGGQGLYLLFSSLWKLNAIVLSGLAFFGFGKVSGVFEEVLEVSEEDFCGNFEVLELVIRFVWNLFKSWDCFLLLQFSKTARIKIFDVKLVEKILKLILLLCASINVNHISL